MRPNRKTLVIELCVFVIFSVLIFPGQVSSSSTSFQKMQDPYKSSSDWWPMFGHDPSCTHFTTSSAPGTCLMLWNHTTLGGISYSSPAIIDSKVYIGSLDHRIYCFDAISGEILWFYATGHYITSSPAVANGRVYIGSYDHYVYCLNESTGELVWSYYTANNIVLAPTINADKVFIGSGNSLYCFNASTGDVLWSYYSNFNSFCSSPAIADGKVYIGNSYGHVYCLNESTGAYIWDLFVGDGDSSLAITEGSVIVASQSGHVYRLNGATGEVIWNVLIESGLMSSPAVAYGRVYLKTPTKLMCLNTTSSVPYWYYSIGDEGGTHSSPAVADGKVYFGLNNGYLYSLNALTGSYLWSSAIGYDIESSPAIADGKIYIGSSDARMYCFGEVNQPPTFGTPSPVNESTGQPTILTWSIPINDPEGNAFDWTIQCSNSQTSSGTSTLNGTCLLNLTGLTYSTTYFVWVNATDSSGSGLYTRQWYTFSTEQIPNQPPYKPVIEGPNQGDNRNAHQWNFTATDPENEDVFFFVDWGDGTPTAWTAESYHSGQTMPQSHWYAKKGTYTIQAKAKDVHGAESDWGTLSVTMPYEPQRFPVIHWLLDRFPHAFPMLRHIFE